MNNNMNNIKERIYVLGATGNIGPFVLKELIKEQVQITAYTRTPEKLYKAIPEAQEHQQLSIVQGGFDDLTPFNESIGGHTRLFLLVPDIKDMTRIKIELGKKAYDAGVKQIVDLSVQSLPWRYYLVSLPHQETEKALFYYSNRKSSTLVSLRPSNFMTNMLFSLETIQKQDMFMEELDPSELQEWISPNDIGQIAARILMEPIEKHGDSAYELIGDVKTPQERAVMFSKILGRPIEYQQVEPQVIYDTFIKMGFDHALAYSVSTFSAKNPTVTRGLQILLGRKPETVYEWLEKNKDTFLSKN